MCGILSGTYPLFLQMARINFNGFSRGLSGIFSQIDNFKSLEQILEKWGIWDSFESLIFAVKYVYLQQLLDSFGMRNFNVQYCGFFGTSSCVCTSNISDVYCWNNRALFYWLHPIFQNMYLGSRCISLSWS